CVNYLLEKRLLKQSPHSIAYFLHCTPNLCKKQLGRYLGTPANESILDAYLSFFDFQHTRLDFALRLFLTSLRLPGKATAIDHMMVRLTKAWFEANREDAGWARNLSEEKALQVVYAVMSLNADLHSAGYIGEKTTFGDFAERVWGLVGSGQETGFGDDDMTTPIPRSILEATYDSIKSEKLEMAETNVDVSSRIGIEFEGIPYKLSLKSAPVTVTVSLPVSDPHLKLFVHGKGIQCTPSWLDFSTSNVQTFTIRAAATVTDDMLAEEGGAERVLMFYKAGRNVRYYVPLFSKAITLEPAFMKHVFRVDAITSNNNDGEESTARAVSKKYLWAVKDAKRRQKWESTFRQAIDGTLTHSSSGMDSYDYEMFGGGERRGSSESVRSTLSFASIRSRLTVATEVGSDAGSIYSYEGGAAAASGVLGEEEGGCVVPWEVGDVLSFSELVERATF
ncbi:hypothetical protein HK102_006844, partial [Quaeritorhiza haematococci]